MPISLREENRMITLYHCSDARSFRALWMLEEAGLSYDLKLLPFPPRVRKPEYLTENPLGTIPLLIDGDTRMTESAAICEYIAAKYPANGLAVTPDEPGFGDYLNALHFGEATLTFPQTLVLRYSRLEPEERRQPQVALDYAKWFNARLRGLDARLELSDYVAAGRFTAADVSVAYALLLSENLQILDRASELVHAYWARMQDRPAFRRAKEAQGKKDW